jgi:hypothetical protein
MPATCNMSPEVPQSSNVPKSLNVLPESLNGLLEVSDPLNGLLEVSDPFNGSPEVPKSSSKVVSGTKCSAGSLNFQNCNVSISFQN